MVTLPLVFQFLQPSDGRLYVRAGVVVQGQAPPAAVSTQGLQCQIPTARPFILVLPQKGKCTWRAG